MSLNLKNTLIWLGSLLLRAMVLLGFAWFIATHIANAQSPTLIYNPITGLPDLISPVNRGTTLPSACTTGDMFFKTNATAGQNLFYCTSTNTWTVQTTGAGSGTIASTALALKGDGAGGAIATTNTTGFGTGTLVLGASKTATINNSITFAGTDSTTMTFPSTSATLARTDAANTFTGHQTVEGVTSTGATGTGKFVFDTAPTVGVLTATSVNKWTLTAPTTAATLTAGVDSQVVTTPAIVAFTPGQIGKVSAAVSTLTSTNGAAATIYFTGMTLDRATYLTSGRILRAHVGGTHTTSGAAPPNATMGWALCSVSGCGSGTTINLGFATFAPVASNATEMPWACDIYIEFQSTTVVQTTGQVSFASAAPTISSSNSQSATTVKNFGTLTAGLSISALSTGNWFLTPYFGYTNVANTATFNANLTTLETIN